MFAAPLHAQQLPPQFTSAPPSIQALVRRQMKGEHLSPADSAKVVAYAKSAAIASTGVASPAVQALMEKAMSGKPLTAAERAELAHAMMSQRMGSAAPSAEIVKRAAAGKAPSKAEVDSMRTAGFAQGRAIAAKGDSAVSSCPSNSAAASMSKPLQSKADLMEALNAIVKTYTAKLGPAASGRIANEHTNAAGVGLWMIGQIDAAVVVLARASLASPTPHTMSNLGAALNAANDYQTAWLILDAADRVAPGSPALLTNLGIAYAGLGRDSLAEQRLRSALRAAPTFAQAHIDLATMLKCAKGHAPKHLAARQEAEQAQDDWFDAEEDREIRMMRAEEGLPVSGPKAESEYTPRRPMMMTAFGGAQLAGSPSGDVEKPTIPGSVQEFLSLFMGKHYINESSRLMDRAQQYHAAAARERDAYARARQRWVAAATANDIRVPMSHDAALIGLARRRSRMYYDVAQSSAMMMQDYASAGARLDQAWKDALAKFGQHPCPIVGPAAKDAYNVARAAVSAHANRVDKIMQDYADDARQWIGAMVDPRLVAASINDVSGDADAAGARLQSDAMAVPGEAFMSWALTCGPKNGKEEPPKTDAATVKAADPCSLPNLPTIPLGPVALVLGCDGLEFKADVGVAVEGKYNRVTRSGTVFIGGGLDVPTGWDDPVTTLGKGATKAAGMVSAGGKAGLLFKFDQGGLSDAGFEFAMSGSNGKTETTYAVDLTIVGGLQLSPDLQHALDGLDAKMWDPPPAPGKP
ncbi:MAG TPA: hypothetical protein VHB25_06215 [Gemmatimonadaceae bacterium]|nr:hypothetical protein [Gemmatimonadaceae bacterium]